MPTDSLPPAPTYPRPQWLEGRLTALSLMLAGIGAAASWAGYHLPTEQATNLLGWIAANWDSIMVPIGLLVGAYGQLRRNRRASPPQAPSNSTAPRVQVPVNNPLHYPGAHVLAALLLPLVMCLSSCVAASGDGRRWAVASLGTDASRLTASAAGVEAVDLNQIRAIDLVRRGLRDAAGADVLVNGAVRLLP